MLLHVLIWCNKSEVSTVCKHRLVVFLYGWRSYTAVTPFCKWKCQWINVHQQAVMNSLVQFIVILIFHWRLCLHSSLQFIVHQQCCSMMHVHNQSQAAALVFRSINSNKACISQTSHSHVYNCHLTKATFTIISSCADKEHPTSKTVPTLMLYAHNRLTGNNSWREGIDLVLE